MVKIVLVDKNKKVKTINVNKFSIDTLYKKCKFRSPDDFKKRTMWSLDATTNVSLYAKDNGRANTENKYEFPSPVDNDLYYGNVGLVAHTEDECSKDSIVPFTDEQWNKMYEKLMGGFESLGDEDSYSSEEEVDPKMLTSEGYLKDGFVVSDKSRNEKIAYNSEEDSDFKPDSASSKDYSDDNEDDNEYEGDNEENDEEGAEEDDEEEDEEDEEEDEEEEPNSELSEDEYEYE